MKKKNLAVLFVLSVMTLIGCSDDDYEDQRQDQVDENFTISDDPAQLDGAISLEGAGVLSVNSLNVQTRQNLSSARASEEADETPQIADIALEQIALIESPIVNGFSLRASHVDVNGDYAYISYLKEGDDYLGGIDIVNVKDKTKPYVISRLTAAAADMSAVHFLNNKLYFASAFNTDEFSDLSSPATMGVVSISNGFFEDDFILKPIPGFAAVDVLAFSNKILGVSGTNGVSGLYSPDDLSTIAEIELPDLRSATYNDGKLGVLSGTDGVFILDPNDLSVLNSFPVKTMENASKRTIAFDADRLLVSEGKDGVGIYDINSGTLVEHVDIPVLADSNIDVTDQVTNAVSLTDGFILMANGGAGFGIARLNEDNQLTDAGIVGIDGSTNYIKAVDDFIFVASGEGGMRILKVSKPDATDPNFVECDSYTTYNGNSNLNVNSNEEIAHRGTATLKNLNVGGKFTFCGSLNVEKNANLNSNGEFNMRGSLAVGGYRGNTTLNINSNATLRVEGSLTIYGDLNLNSGSTLEFVGDDSTIHVYGRVRKNSGSTIIGNYTDTSRKL